MDHAYLGPEATMAEIGRLVDHRAKVIEAAGYQIEIISDEAALCRKTADAFAEGLVVGWFQGRMEWGPRALGNRSIVCDPRRADLKDILKPQDQAARKFLSLCAIDLARPRRRVVRGGRRRPFHDAGFSDSRGEAESDPGRDAC
jgi:predicted NodU family carbamoyl transferase